MNQILDTLLKIDFSRALAILAIVCFGAFALRNVFKHMKSGFGPFNVRITGILFVGTLASILAAATPSAESAAIGILGAIAGYLFGYDGKNSN